LGLLRNGDSAEKYVTAVKWFCDWQRYPVEPWFTRSFQQRLRGLKAEGKRVAPPARARPLPREVVRRLVRQARSLSQFDFSLVCVLASAFLLRVPSEALPLSFDAPQEHSSLAIRQESDRQVLVLSLRRRKNVPAGTVLKRACSCTAARDLLCPVHALSEWHARTGRAWSGRLFRYPPTSFRRDLQRAVRDLGLENPESFSSHSFRRGTAQDMSLVGSSLAEILEAGQWRSSAFMKYLCKADLEQAAVLDVFLAGSDSESEGPAPSTGARKREAPGKPLGRTR